MKYFTDETIKKHIEKYGQEEYVRILEEKLVKGRQVYERKKGHVEHILERIKKDFH